MIAKKIVPLLLLALVFFIPSASASAYSFPDEPLEITDAVKEKMWTRVFTQAQAGEPYYLICYLKDGLPYVFTFSDKPYISGCFFEDSEVKLYLTIKCREYESAWGTSTYSSTSSWGVDTSTGNWDLERDSYVESTDFTRRFVLYGVPEPPKNEDGEHITDSKFIAGAVDSSKRFLFSNFSIDFFDGVKVFHRAPLVLNTSLTQKITSGAETVETEPGKVATVVVMIAVSSVLLFPFLATFLKKSLHSLLGLPVASNHGFRKSKRH